MSNARQRLMLAGIFGSVLCLVVYFWWLATFNSNINFLTSHSPARWILFPQVMAGSMRSSIEVNSTFHRSFVVSKDPIAAQLSVCAMKRWEISLNGFSLSTQSTADAQWKKIEVMDVASRLHPGTNDIVVTIYNSNGPPALWLSLQMDGGSLITDSSWKVRLLDSVECNAALASEPPALNPGNPLRAQETPLAGFCNHWVFYCCSLMAAALLVSVFWRLSKRRTEFFSGNNFALCMLALLALLWIALYWNNLPLLTLNNGFDSGAHLDYIQWVCTRPSLPLANQGWQMYQPPLYYIISAFTLGILNPATIAGQVMAIRVLGLAIGIVHITLIFLSLHLVFPKRPGMQVFGLMLATLLPAHLYLSQFVTNETLAAMLVTASLYVCLKIIIEQRDSWGIFVVLGLTFGAALLTKATAILAAPFIALALVDPLMFRESSRLKRWLSNIVAAGGTCFAVCGWHYYRDWAHFGSPLVGNWDTAVWPSWWMDPGYTTWSYFFRFGQCLVHPWFSGMNGFADGLYSTLWGDALFSGSPAVEYRASWNYELMAAGFLLALVPALLIVLGAIRTVKKLICENVRIWLLLSGVLFAVFAALIYMNLKVPSYGEAKAFYGLIGLMPLCVCGALGFDALTRWGKTALWVTSVVIGVWAINVYATYWIRAATPESQMHLGLSAQVEGNTAASLAHYSEALRLAPHDVQAKAWLAIELAQQNRTNEINDLLAQAIHDPLPAGKSHFYIAQILSLTGQLDAAVREARQSLDTDPDNALAHHSICAWLSRLGHYAEAISAGRDAERVCALTPALQYDLGGAFAGAGDQTNAAMHFRLCVQLQPDWPEARDRFGISLLALGQYVEATNQFCLAVEMRPNDPTFRYHLAAAFADSGDSSSEIQQYREILASHSKFLGAAENLAWRLATTPETSLRDGAEAVQLASGVCQWAGTNDTRFPATLAAAYASVGMFDEAAQTMGQAIVLAERAKQPDAVAQEKKMLKLFQAGQPYVDENPRKLILPLDSEEQRSHD